MLRSPAARFVAAALLPLLAACGSSIREGAQKTTPPQAAAPVAQAPAPVQPPAPVPAPDPVLSLIAASEHHFDAGKKELEAGHVAAAKIEFDKAVDVLLESSYGGRGEPRIRE